MTLRSTKRTNLVGLLNPVILDTRRGGRIEIGENSSGSGVVISSKELISIGKNVKLGGNVRIFDHDFHSFDFEERRDPETYSQLKSAPINIGDDVFIGTNATILKGITIGNRVIIGASSVVAKSIPSDEVWAGNPAKFIKKI